MKKYKKYLNKFLKYFFVILILITILISFKYLKVQSNKIALDNFINNKNKCNIFLVQDKDEPKPKSVKYKRYFKKLS